MSRNRYVQLKLHYNWRRYSDSLRKRASLTARVADAEYFEEAADWQRGGIIAQSSVGVPPLHGAFDTDPAYAERQLTDE